METWAILVTILYYVWLLPMLVIKKQEATQAH